MNKPTESNKKMKPCLHIENADLPMIKNAQLGEVVNLTIKGKITSLNQGYDDKSKVSASIEIQSINDKDFESKGYKDVIEETEGIEPNDEESNND